MRTACDYLIQTPRDRLLCQLILAKLVNKLPRFYQIQWIIAKKTAFGRNTQYHEVWQSQIPAWE